MENFKKILKFLSGKKTIISGIIMTTSAFLATKNVIDVDTSAYINAITTLIFGSASVATGRLLYKGDVK